MSAWSMIKIPSRWSSSCWKYVWWCYGMVPYHMSTPGSLTYVHVLTYTYLRSYPSPGKPAPPPRLHGQRQFNQCFRWRLREVSRAVMQGPSRPRSALEPGGAACASAGAPRSTGRSLYRCQDDESVHAALRSVWRKGTPKTSWAAWRPGAVPSVTPGQAPKRCRPLFGSSRGRSPRAQRAALS